MKPTTSKTSKTSKTTKGKKKTTKLGLHVLTVTEPNLPPPTEYPLQDPLVTTLQALQTLFHSIQENKIPQEEATSILYQVADAYTQTMWLTSISTLEYPHQWKEALTALLDPSLQETTTHIWSRLERVLQTYLKSLQVSDTLHTFDEIKNMCSSERLYTMSLEAQQKYPFPFPSAFARSCLARQSPTIWMDLPWGIRFWIYHVRQCLLEPDSSSWDRSTWLEKLKHCPFPQAECPSDEDLALLFYPRDSYLPIPLPLIGAFLSHFIGQPSFIAERDRFLRYHSLDGFYEVLRLQDPQQEPWWEQAGSSAQQQRQQFWYRFFPSSLSSSSKTIITHGEDETHEDQDGDGFEQDEEEFNQEEVEEDTDNLFSSGDYEEDEEKEDNENEKENEKNNKKEKTKGKGKAKKGSGGGNMYALLKSAHLAKKEWKKKEYAKVLASAKEDKSKKTILPGTKAWDQSHRQYLQSLSWYPLFLSFTWTKMTHCLLGLHENFLYDRSTYFQQCSKEDQTKKSIQLLWGKGLLVYPVKMNMTTNISSEKDKIITTLTKTTLLSIPPPRFHYIVRLLLQTRPWISKYAYSYFIPLWKETETSSSLKKVLETYCTLPVPPFSHHHHTHQKYFFNSSLYSDMIESIQQKKIMDFPIRVYHVKQDGTVDMVTKASHYKEIDCLYKYLSQLQSALLSFSKYQELTEQLIRQPFLTLPLWMQTHLCQEIHKKMELFLSQHVYEQDPDCDIVAICRAFLSPLTSSSSTSSCCLSLGTVLKRTAQLLSFLDPTSPFFCWGQIVRRRLFHFLYRWSSFLTSPLHLWDLYPLPYLSSSSITSSQQNLIETQWTAFTKYTALQLLFQTYPHMIPTVRKVSATTMYKKNFPIESVSSFPNSDVLDDIDEAVFRLWAAKDAETNTVQVETVEAVLNGLTDVPLETLIDEYRLKQCLEMGMHPSRPFRKNVVVSLSPSPTPKMSAGISNISNEVEPILSPTNTSVFLIPDFFEKVKHALDTVFISS